MSKSVMSSRCPLVGVLILAALLTGCGAHGAVGIGIGGPGISIGIGTGIHIHDDESPPPVEIPPDYLPPPGKCRIWYPDRAPDQQPPPGDCRELQRELPSDAKLIRGKE